MEPANVTCPISGAPMRPWMTMPVDWVRRAPTQYGELYWCEVSEFGAVSPRPTASELSELYDLESYYTHGDDHFATDDDYDFIDKLRRHIAWRFDSGKLFSPELVSAHTGGRKLDILEFGAGGGHLLAELAKMGHRPVGVEIDPRARCFELGLEIHRGTAEDVPEPIRGRSFDIICMRHVLEHCLDHLAALRNVHGLLRPGGLFIANVPNNASLGLRTAGPVWPLLGVPRHLNFFTPTSLRASCEKSGLEVLEFFFGGYCRQFSNGWIATQTRIFERLKASSVTARPRAKPPTKWRAWRLLLSTIKARPELKYDSVGVVARKHT